MQTRPTDDQVFVPIRGENAVVAVSDEKGDGIGRVEVGARPHVTVYAAVPREIPRE